MDVQTWLRRVEEAVDDRAALEHLAEEVKTADLGPSDRLTVEARIGRYIADDERAEPELDLEEPEESTDGGA